MGNIANQLKDPSWWFTAFFVAILASVVAGFLKDKFEIWLGSLSSNLRIWREKRKIEREKVIEALLTNDIYLHIALFRVVVSLILFAISVVIYSTAPVMLSMAPSSYGFSIMSMQMEKSILVWKIFMPTLGIFTAYIGYKATSRISIVYEAIKLFRIKHGLPRLP